MMIFLFIEFVVLTCGWVGFSVGKDSGRREVFRELQTQQAKLLEAVSRVGRLGE